MESAAAPLSATGHDGEWKSLRAMRLLQPKPGCLQETLRKAREPWGRNISHFSVQGGLFEGC